MNKLELLWKLEEHNVNLDRNLKELDILKKGLEIKDVEKKIISINKKLKRLDNNKGIIKACISKHENSLSQYEYEIKSLNDKLYKDNITDIKQLEYLSFEKEEMKKKLKEIEIEMIAYMEEDESIEEKFKNNTSMLKELNNNSNKKDHEITNKLKNLEEKIKQEENKIKEIVEKLDADLLKQYNSLKERKNMPIVVIENNICVGCNMRLPMYQLEELKDKSNIINCESCGRILYLRD